MIRPWKVFARRVLFSRPPWIKVGDEQVELPDGRVVEDYPWIRTRDFAIVVAITPEGQVVLERVQTRSPQRRGRAPGRIHRRR